MTKIFYLLLNFLIVINCEQIVLDPVVQLPDGKVQGKLKLSSQDTKYYEFEGIPYAKAPIGELRFEEPVPVEPWKGVKISQTRVGCTQYEHNPYGEYSVIGEEDCLHINIYTPKIDENAKMNVFVYIHGGAFMYGAPNHYYPQNLIDKNVVIVTLSYRLGPLGFLSTEDEVLPGNYGLKDQNLALKWIKNNIQHFGGNPENIIITGCSAGGASVHFHYLTPWSRGLFKKGISLSGSTLNPWPISENNLEKTKRLAMHVGCPIDSSEKIKECLKQRADKEIAQAAELFFGFLYSPFSPFGPVIDKNFAKNPFLPDYPEVLLKTGKVYDVPWLVSVMESEGLYPLSDLLKNVNILKDIDRHWVEYSAYFLDYNYTIKDSDREIVAKKIKSHYLKNEPFKMKTFRDFVDMVSDRLYVSGIVKSAKLQSKVNKSPVFFYKSYYTPKLGLKEIFGDPKYNVGASHGDDSFLLFSPYDAKDKDMAEFYTNIWITFGKSGKPELEKIKWEPVCENESLTYLEIINSKDYQLKSSSKLGQIDFWDKLPIN